jgi:hypothetical protein
MNALYFEEELYKKRAGFYPWATQSEIEELLECIISQQSSE